MPKDVPWFRHDFNARRDPKLAALATEYGIEGIGRWWILVEILREQSDYRLPIDRWTPLNLAREWTTPRGSCSPEEAQQFIDALVDTFHLLLRSETHLWSVRLKGSMTVYEKLCDQRKAAAQARWHKDDDASAMREHTNIEATALREDAGKNAPASKTDAMDLTGLDLTRKDLTGLDSASPPSSAAAALKAAPLSVGDVLPLLTRINPRAEVPAADEPALAALLAVHGTEAVVAAYAAYQRLNPGRRMHWFIIDFARYRNGAKIEASRSPPLPDPDHMRQEIAREEAEHPELVAEAERKSAELKAKMHPKAPSTSAADDWEATAPGEDG
jgi:hypothetical protein